MRRILKTALATALALLTCIAAQSASASQKAGARAPGKFYVAGFDRDEDALDFFKRLQSAVAADDRARVVSMMAYPLNVFAGARRIRVRRRADLLRRYDAVFNRNVRDALARQQASDLFANWRGVMVGNGQIWFAPLADNSVKVITVNTSTP